MENTGRKGEFTEIKVMAYQLEAIRKAFTHAEQTAIHCNPQLAIALIKSSIEIYLGREMDEAERYCAMSEAEKKEPELTNQ